MRPIIDIARLEKAVFELANFERKRASRKPLAWNKDLAAIARLHSSYLAQQNTGLRNTFYLAHDDTQGSTPAGRLEQNNVFYFDKSAENLHANSIIKTFLADEKNTPVAYNTEEELAKKAAGGWMRSPVHRQNLLSGAYDETGVGIAMDPTGVNYLYTQLFIHRVECGYKTSICCERRGFLPYCFVPLHCNEERACI